MAKDPVVPTPAPKVPKYVPVQASRRVSLVACDLCGAFVHDQSVHTAVCPGR